MPRLKAVTIPNSTGTCFANQGYRFETASEISPQIHPFSDGSGENLCPTWRIRGDFAARLLTAWPLGALPQIWSFFSTSLHLFLSLWQPIWSQAPMTGGHREWGFRETLFFGEPRTNGLPTTSP